MKITFHNYTISAEGTEPKEANLCPIRNMETPRDIHQVRAFLGCCQQLSGYVDKYGIMARPLQDLNNSKVPFPNPWVKGSPYDVAFHALKSALLDGTNFLYNKDALKRLFIEVDASDAGWGACVYQMKEPFKGDPNDEGRARENDKGPRQVIYWISKAWTEHELRLPVFYRESLARLLALERFRNLIETNIDSGITLYTDHKPGLYENSLSNKGQLSAWRLLENADLLSIVEHRYRKGGLMLLADPLSRICSPVGGFYDATLPSKFAAVMKLLPNAAREARNLQVYANKDTLAISRMVQKWRKPTNPIIKGKLTVGGEVRDKVSTTDFTFRIGSPHADTGVEELGH
jgi:hypothetical protein